MVEALSTLNWLTRRPTGVSSAVRSSYVKLLLAASLDGGMGGRSATNLKTSDCAFCSAMARFLQRVVTTNQKNCFNVSSMKGAWIPAAPFDAAPRRDAEASVRELPRGWL